MTKVRILLAVIIALFLAFSANAAVTVIKKPPASSSPWAHVGDLGTATSVASASTLDLTTSATLESGNVGICVIAKDETGSSTTDGTGQAQITSITDSASNTWTEAIEWCNMQNSTGSNGACVAIYYTKATTQLTSGSTITTTIPANVTSIAVTCKEFTGSTISLASGSTGVADDNADPSALSVATGENREHLFIRGTACESNVSGYTVDTDYTAFTDATRNTGAALTSQAVRAEFRIATEATSATSDPTYTSADCASAMIGLNSD